MGNRSELNSNAHPSYEIFFTNNVWPNFDSIHKNFKLCNLRYSDESTLGGRLRYDLDVSNQITVTLYLNKATKFHQTKIYSSHNSGICHKE